jgi:hypothetical protein
MSRKKRMQNVREAKDRRAKKLAIGGGVLLVAVLAYQMSHMLGGKKAAAAPAVTTTAVGTSSAPTATGTTGAAVAPTTAPGTAGAAVLPMSGSTKLTNSDAEPERSKSELDSFSDFSGKDPFAQQLSSGTGSTTSTTSSTSSGQTTSATSPNTAIQTTSAHKHFARQGSSAPSSRSLAQTGLTTIAVNGRVETVRVGAGFPSANPLFRLVSVSNGVARIGLADGSYSSGAHTVSLAAGHTLTLVDTADGIRYKLQLRAAG